MHVPLIEPAPTRYIRLNPTTNEVHLYLPIVGGQDVSTDNTCKAQAELKTFFDGAAQTELAAYKSLVEFHMALLEPGDAKLKAEDQLAQINIYLEAVGSLKDRYQGIVDAFLAKPVNLYSIQLRPRDQDPESKVLNPVFTVNRRNDASGTPLSHLYRQMHEFFARCKRGKPDPTAQLKALLKTEFPDQVIDVEAIQQALSEHCRDAFDVTVDFKQNIQCKPVNKEFIDELMGFTPVFPATMDDYIDALIGTCAPNLSTLLSCSPFYLETYHSNEAQAESLSIMTQFYLGVFNVYCRAKGLSHQNFGKILDASPILSQALVQTIVQTLAKGAVVEAVVFDFIKTHQVDFKLSRELTPLDHERIQQKFTNCYRTVTATKENPHMDDFMFLDTDDGPENKIFFTQHGLICMDFSNIITAGPHQAYFDKIRHAAPVYLGASTPLDNIEMVLDITPEVLMDKLADVSWDNLPEAVITACRATPAFKLYQFLDHVAKGQQDEAQGILSAFEDKQLLLTARAKFSDYSGRIFRCSAYEFAYWAKDTHMRRMLESAMDDETKKQLLNRVKDIESNGLSYQQHGVTYQNPHYDMSFVLKRLNLNEFLRLQSLVTHIDKINQATVNNYKTVAFSASEYESLKIELVAQISHSMFAPFAFCCRRISPSSIVHKLAFDFHSLLSALKTYVNHYDPGDVDAQYSAWLEIGKAQRDVPANIAQEFCKPGRSFDPCPDFNEATLARQFTHVHFSHGETNWFPLESASSGLGFDYVIVRGKSTLPRSYNRRSMVWKSNARPILPTEEQRELDALDQLDQLRTADLLLSRDVLSNTLPQTSMPALKP